MSNAHPSGLAGLLSDLASASRDASTGQPPDPDREPHGDDQQILYERWLRRPEWRLRDEAVPLLLGMAPEEWPAARSGPDEARVWAAIQAAVTAGGLRIASPGALPEDWGVEPGELCRWATGQRIVLPAPFVTLIDFIRRAVKSPLVEMAEPAETHRASVREQVLGAALNVLVKCPDECYDAHGLASGALIAERIAAQSMRWFDAAHPPMTGTEMAALIDRWLE
jgi:hypothetical protein